MAEGILSQPAPGAKQLRKLTQRLIWVQEAAPVDDDQTSEEAGNFTEQLPEEREEPERDLPPAGGNSQQDTWRITRDLLIITHNKPRTQLFHSTDANCPIPIKYIDIMRTTETDLEEKALNRVEVFWVTDEKELPDSWTGRTTIELLRPLPPVGYS